MKLIKGDFDNYSGLYLINGINQKQINFEEFLVWYNFIIFLIDIYYFPNTEIVSWSLYSDQVFFF
nr:hypothetical protein [Mycoplasmopsis bovis]